MEWRIGNVNNVIIGEDMLAGKDEEFGLSEDLLDLLHNQDIYSLWDAKAHDHSHIGRRGWKSENNMGLIGEHAKE